MDWCVSGLLGIIVFPEQAEQPQVDVEKYRDDHGGNDGDHQKIAALIISSQRKDQGGEIQKNNDGNREQCQDAFGLLEHGYHLIFLKLFICYYKQDPGAWQVFKRIAKHLFL